MFNRQYYIITGSVISILLLLVCSVDTVMAQTTSDSARLMKNVIISSNKTPSNYKTPTPAQVLNHTTLQEINAESIGDAAKYFSGVLIKDYGGVGGLKTISVRGLSALNTGLLYDGIPVADAQTGEIDLSKFSSTFIQSLALDEANPQQILLPARAYASASVLSVATNSFNTINFEKTKWQAAIKQGSFGLWQPSAGIYLPFNKSMVLSANAEALWDKGNYPYTIDNGRFSKDTIRTNTDIKSFQSEINMVKQFRDSTQWQTKLWNYTSQRGLPGSIVFLNTNPPAQRLWDDDFFAQSRYQSKISAYTSLLVSAKYSLLYTRYVDPNPNYNGGKGLDNHYNQQEVYISAAVSHHISQSFLFSIASDFSTTNLTANLIPFATPTRNSWWNSIALQYAKAGWQINGSLLSTVINDKTKIGQPLANKNVVTPTVAVSYKPTAASPFLFRVSYKDIFRMPTFNDLYYYFISTVTPKLSPEYSQQYNAGVTYTKNFNGAVKQFSISADGYYNTVKDKIISQPSQNLAIWTTYNLGKVHITGLDINTEANGNFSSNVKWSLRMAYTWQQALDVTDPSSSEYKNEIPYAPENSGSALATVYYKNWTAGYNFLFSDNSYSLGNNTALNEVGGWDTQDISIARLIKLKGFQATIRGAVNNIFNSRYDVVQYYPMPGRSYKISITFNNL